MESTVAEQTYDDVEHRHDNYDDGRVVLGKRVQDHLETVREQAAALQAEIERLRMTDDFAFVAPFGRVQLLTRMGSNYEVDNPAGVREALAKIVPSENDMWSELAADVAFAVIPWQAENVGSIPEADSVLRIYRVENILWEIERTPAAQPRFFYDIVAPDGRAVGRFSTAKAAESVARRLIQRLPAETWEIEEPEEFRRAFRKSGADVWLKIQEAMHNYGRCDYGDNTPF